MPPTNRRRPSAPALIVVVVFALSRIVYALAGVRFDDGAITPISLARAQWQLLPTTLLEHDLIRSVWYLHSQPPLYNLFAGFLLHLPAGARGPVANAVFIALGLALSLATYVLLVELGVHQWIAAALAIVVTADPATVLYENWLSWSYPTAAFLILGSLGALRLVRTGQARWGLVTASCCMCVLFLDSTFQWPWLVAIGVIIAGTVRHNWRPVLRGAALPLVLVLGWYVKDAVLFGTTTTSSWLGMNLAQMTIYQAPPGQVPPLIANHTLTPLAGVPPFAHADRYVPEFVTVGHYGVPALDDEWSDGGSPNYNSAVYLQVAPRYLSDSLSYVAAEPATYAGDVQRSMQVWFLPSDQYGPLSPNYRQISGYARAFDSVVLVQPSFGGPYTGLRAETARKPPALPTESWTVVLMMLIVVLAAPVLLFRHRQTDPTTACVGLVMWVTVVYGFGVTSLVSLGENNRFRFELGPLPVVLLALVVVVARHEFRSRKQPAVTVAD